MHNKKSLILNFSGYICISVHTLGFSHSSNSLTPSKKEERKNISSTRKKRMSTFRRRRNAIGKAQHEIPLRNGCKKFARAVQFANCG